MIKLFPCFSESPTKAVLDIVVRQDFQRADITHYATNATERMRAGKSGHDFGHVTSRMGVNFASFLAFPSRKMGIVSLFDFLH